MPKIEAETRSKWRIEPLPIHGWRITDETGKEIVHDIYDEDNARQIVRDHNDNVKEHHGE